MGSTTIKSENDFIGIQIKLHRQFRVTKLNVETCIRIFILHHIIVILLAFQAIRLKWTGTEEFYPFLSNWVDKIKGAGMEM